MRTGYYISGAGHGLLLLVMLFGGVFTWEDEEPSIRVTEVSILTEEQFAALSTPQPDPEPAAPTASPPPQRRPDPEPAPEPEPEPPAPAPVPEPAPEAPPAPENVPAPADRIAPTPTPEPDPVAEPAPERVEVPEPAPAEDVAALPPEPVTPTAPPETTTEIRPEPPSAAPETSPRPRRRPTPPTQVAEPDPTPEPEPDTPSVADAIDDAVSDAISDAVAETTPDAPQGPPLTGGEKDAMRLAVSACWNLGALSTEAMATVVEVGFDMARDGKPDPGSIELLSHTGGSADAANQAFQAARRAIIRCGTNGYDLPDEKYDHWKRIEITFNPDNMRWR
jgi:hypothetical protein